MSRNHYQLLEAGLSDRAKSTAANPRLTTLMSLARVLDINVPEFMIELFEPFADNFTPRGGRHSTEARPADSEDDKQL